MNKLFEKVKKIKYLLILFVVILLFGAFSISGEASSLNKSKEIKIKNSSNSLEISWEVDGNRFKLFDLNNELLLLEGSQNNYISNNLEPETLYRFKLQSYNGDQLDQVYVFSGITKKDNNKEKSKGSLQETNLELSSTLATSLNQVDITWDSQPNVTQYKILKNSEYVTTVYSNSYTDYDIKPNSYNIYEIQFSVPLNDEEKMEVKSFYEENGKNLSDEELQKLSVKPYSIIKVVDTRELLSEETLEAYSISSETTENLVDDVYETAGRTVKKSFAMTYKTFIPDDYVQNPLYNYVTLFKDIKWFAGDNRTFGLNYETFRTKFFGKSIFYSDNTTAYQYSKKVSATKAYDGNLSFYGSKTDSGELIYNSQIAKTATYTEHTYYHKSGNPYAPSTATIDILMKGKTYKSGSYRFFGQHDRAPAHELYLQIDSGAQNLQLFAHPHEGFHYLGGPSTLSRSFDISN